VTAYAAGIAQLQAEYPAYGAALRRHFDPTRP
jgi:homogentisate 1,2-dioxygenase